MVCSIFEKPLDDLKNESEETVVKLQSEIEDEKLDILKFILERVDEENINAINNDGCTALYYGKL